VRYLAGSAVARVALGAVLGLVQMACGDERVLTIAVDLSDTRCADTELVDVYLVDDAKNCLIRGPESAAAKDEIRLGNLSLEAGSQIELTVLALRQLDATTKLCLCAANGSYRVEDGLQDTIRLRPLFSTRSCLPPREEPCDAQAPQ